MRRITLFLLLLFLALPACALEAPPFSEELLADSAGMDSYQIRAVFDPEELTLTCIQRVTGTNRTGETLSELVFHVYPNAFQSAETSPVPTAGDWAQPFSPGGTLFASVMVEEQPVEASLAGDDHGILLVPGQFAPEAQWSVQMEYQVVIPSYEFRFGNADRCTMLGNVFPILAVYEEGDWRTDAYAPVGDPFYSECANWTLEIETPTGYAIAGTGALREEQVQGDTVTRRYEARAAREYALMIGSHLALASREVEGVLIESYAPTARQAETALDMAEQVLRFYLYILGDPYPYPTLTVAQAPLGFVGGMEYPAYLVINETAYERGREDTLLRVIAHEMAHQWWYAQVGSDQIYDPWLDEGLAEYQSLLALSRLIGEDAFYRYVEERIEPAMRISLPPGATLASPIWQFSTWSEYDQVVYKRAAGMIHGLHQALGDESFLSVLRTFLAENRYGIANRESFAAAIEQVTGENWRGYLDDYLDSRN